MFDRHDRHKIDIREFKEAGLYLITNKKRIEFTKTYIQQIAKSYWEDERKLPSKIKEATEFKRCSFCPLNKTGGMCDAIRPIIPLLDKIKGFKEHDLVTAVFKESKKGEDAINVAETFMNNALRYLSLVSFVYCASLKRFRKYLLGVIPIVDAKSLARQVYMNIFFFNKGDWRKFNEVLTELRNEVTEVCANQTKRLDLLTRDDALKGAYFNSQLITEIYSSKIGEIVEDELRAYGYYGDGTDKAAEFNISKFVSSIGALPKG